VEIQASRPETLVQPVEAHILTFAESALSVLIASNCFTGSDIATQFSSAHNEKVTLQNAISLAIGDPV
jgi:hypothetical protein